MPILELNSVKTDKYFLQSEWVVNIQIPSKVANDFAKILGDEVPLMQGNYSHCMYIRDNGRCRFKGNKRAHGGAEETVQEVELSEIIISIPQEHEILEKILRVINQYHVHEEPTVRVSNAFGFRTLCNSDTKNPNKYWNCSDSKEIHGTPVI
ncbi:MAG: hypothetical protein R1F54_06625 [Candidatus Zeuxoniibacter abyssi]|nr:MAG: hypothetical protein R1F54_06625 [Candidatus Persebacteraceae bacterium AB1(2)]